MITGTINYYNLLEPCKAQPPILPLYSISYYISIKALQALEAWASLGLNVGESEVETVKLKSHCNKNEKKKTTTKKT